MLYIYIYIYNFSAVTQYNYFTNYTVKNFTYFFMAKKCLYTIIYSSHNLLNHGNAQMLDPCTNTISKRNYDS